jgi:hypothetical protein
MSRAKAIGTGIVFCAMLIPVALTGQGKSPDEHRALPHVYLPDPVARGTVVRAVIGAAVRLARPGCRQVFTDFADSAGQPLLAEIEGSTRTAAQYLVERVWFVDGDDMRQCRNDRSTVAFTAAGAHVIRICAARFADRFTRETTAGEVLIIHELLHTLGLGENPPTSADITKQVTKRCGAS